MARERLTPRQWGAERLDRLEERLDRLEDLSISKLVPSALTLLGLCSGATSIAFALDQHWKAAIAAMFCAMLFDMLDGRAARWLGADSRFGVQLDSLADLVSFGVAPAVVIYTWSLSAMGPLGWIVALIFCGSSAIRLARFNADSARDEGATASHPYFVGLPTPAAAAIMLVPLMLSFELPIAAVRNPLFCMAFVAATSALMVSRVPTPSLKYVRLTRDGWVAAVAMLGLAAAIAVFLQWLTLVVGLMIYVATIPLVVHRSRVPAGMMDSALPDDSND